MSAGSNRTRCSGGGVEGTVRAEGAVGVLGAVWVVWGCGWWAVSAVRARARAGGGEGGAAIEQYSSLSFGGGKACGWWV